MFWPHHSTDFWLYRSRGVDIGNLVGPGDSAAIATITQTHRFSVEFSIPQAMLRCVTPIPGREIASRVEVYDLEADR